MYHKYSHQQTQDVPKLLGGILVVMILIAGVLFFKQNHAGLSSKQKAIITQYEVGNISESAVSIFWRTNLKTQSYIAWGDKPTQLHNSAYDNGKSADLLNNHLVLIKDLKPESTYYFQIKQAGRVLGDPQSVYQIKTSKKKQTLSSVSPLYGTVRAESDKPVTNAVVILKSPKIIPLIASVKADGTFLFSLCCTINTNREAVELTDKDEIEMTLIDEGGNSLVVKDSLKKMLAQSTSFVIGSKYQLVDAAGEAVQKSEEQTILPAFSQPTIPQVKTVQTPDDRVVAPTEGPKSFDILYPFEGASIASGKPLIKGLAPGSSIIDLTFSKNSKTKSKNSENRQFMRTRVDDRGVWSFSPVIPLLPGEYTLSAQIEGSDKKEALARVFTIQKSGEAVLGDATGSATLTPTIELTETPSPTPVLSTTIVPTTVIPTKEPPITGFSIVPIAGISILCIIVGLGFLLIF